MIISYPVVLSKDYTCIKMGRIMGVRVGLREQRARERAERAEAARKAREDRDKKRQEEREAAAKAKKK